MAKRRGIGEKSGVVSIIGDEDTVTGFLLTGIGEKNIKGESNYFIVGPQTKEADIQNQFSKYLQTPNIAVILVTQVVAEKHLRHLINDHEEILPTILEIPSKESPYDPVKDPIMQQANRMLYGSELK